MNPLNRTIRAALGLVLAGSIALASCKPPTETPPPPPPPPSGVGPAGGTVSGPNGAQVVIPAGALSSNTAIAVAQSSSGAPALPTGMASFGQMYAFTPHGTTFAIPVTVTVPFDPASVPTGRTPVLYKTTAGQAGWERVAGATVSGGLITAQVTGFSNGIVGSFPPTITQQPQNATVTEPATASFSVNALGFPPFTFQWERSDDGGVTWAAAAGLTAATGNYTTPATTVAADHNDRYRVIVSNFDGPTTSNVVTLTVAANIVAPTITTQPSNVTVAVGGNATFTVVAAGTNPTYQWQQSTGGGAFTNIVGATNASYTLTNVQAANTGARFQAVVSNSAGTVTSNPATLTVGSVQPIPLGAALAAGKDFSLARSTMAGLVSWGSDASGQLGAGVGNQTRNAPGSTGVNNAVVVAAGALHGLAVRATGEVLAWGDNAFGQLGNGGSASAESPVTTTVLSGNPIDNAVSVCAGARHSLVLRSAPPNVLAMGDNGQGQLGDGSTTGRPRAVPVQILALGVVAVACGADFSLALLFNGVVYAWGANASGQLGNGSTTPSSVPVPVLGLSPFPGAKVGAIAAGKDHALALIVNDHGISVQVMAWGSNRNGKLGPNGPGGSQIQTTPVLVGSLPSAVPGVASIAAGDENSVAVMKNGQVYVWGINETGQLGRGSLSPGFDNLPGLANLPGSCFAREVAVGRKDGLSHLLARCLNGSVYAWGYDDLGQLGLGNTNPIVSTPTLVPGLFIFEP